MPGPQGKALCYSAGLALMVFAAAWAAAQAAEPDPAAAARARSNMLARTGGFLEREGEGPVILFLNMQSRVPEKELAEPPATLTRVLRCVASLESRKPPKDPVAEAQAALKGKGAAGAVVGVCDAPGLPPLLIAPESRWALVNVAALAADKPSAEVLAVRARKELWRAFAHLMGAAESTFEQCLMKPVFSLADLDALAVNSVCPEPFSKIMANARRLGIRPVNMATYRKACEEGWAPAPTNDFQRAVWDEVKAKRGK